MWVGAGTSRMIPGDDSARDRPGHHPLLWVALPLVVGVAAAPLLPAAAALPLAAAGLLVALGALLALLTRPGTPRAWAGLTVFAVLLLALAYGRWRTPEPPDWTGLPPRAIEADLHVSQVTPPRRFTTRLTGYGYLTGLPSACADANDQPLQFSMRVENFGAREAVLPGAVLRVRGELRAVDPAAVNRNAEFESYLKRAGFAYVLRRVKVVSVETPPGAWAAFASRTRQHLEGALRETWGIYTGPAAETYVAMVLGQKAALTPRQREAMTLTGVMHLFAISGLNVGVLACGLMLVFRKVRVRESIGAAIGLCVLYLYVEATGASASALRAFLMAACFWGARLLPRKASGLSAVLVSAVFVLLIQPSQVRDVSFQLSYLVVLAIVLYGGPLGAWLWERMRPFRDLPHAAWGRRERFITRWGRALVVSVAISLSATVVTVPLSLQNFHVFAPAGVVLNLVLVPMATAVVWLGSVTMGLAALGLAPLAGGVNLLAMAVLGAMDALVQAAARLPGAFAGIASGSAWAAPLTTALLVAWMLAGREVGPRSRPVAAAVWLGPVAVATAFLGFTLALG